MELIEISDEGLIPVSSHGHNLFFQPMHDLAPSQLINNGNGTIEVLDEIMTTASLDGSSYFQLVNPNPPPPMIVSYAYGSDGTLIPIYDSFPMDNTVTILTTEPDIPSDPVIPPHVLDHMYAKKPKEPGSVPPAKPRKRVKKKEPVVTPEHILPEVTSANTTKVNIIRKGLPVTATTTFRPLISRPKILQSKSGVSSINSPKNVASVTSGSNCLSSSSTPSFPVKSSSLLSSSSPSSSSFPRLTPSGKTETRWTCSSVSEESERTPLYLSSEADEVPQLDDADKLTLNSSWKRNRKSSSVRGSSTSTDLLSRKNVMLPTSSSTLSSTSVTLDTEGDSEVATIQLSDSAIAAITRSGLKDEAVITLTEHEHEMFGEFSMDEMGSETGLQLGNHVYFSYT